MTLIPAWKDGRLAPSEKLAVHREGLRHKAISVFVTHEGQTLLQRRAAGKYHSAGLWANACCTHPDWDEGAEACAQRRLREELGLQGAPLQHRGVIEYRADVGGGMIEHEVVDLFTAELAARPTLAPDPEEVSETRWIGWEALRQEVEVSPERFTAWLRIYLAEHAALLVAQAAPGR
ncbi:isopentenyl-diphosphate Delta-isomerase [Pseudoroseicyclus aestuarii]|uniref:Isopentenyl-diphosphate Delta-isomerase n=1 Tax=Pseudoroseicyclus aestuarii TaxID=1795041 RepID=A0A318SWT0_9RHOB|nr:isopentenyl-diphosphate Delta-isomerase [Pseudoroseicyclus aestuarii]PYE85962.1 isopentenyl-diphosphate delta-isomerase [Pseudoroseicyclus aestuarii]